MSSGSYRTLVTAYTASEPNGTSFQRRHFVPSTGWTTLERTYPNPSILDPLSYDQFLGFVRDPLSAVSILRGVVFDTNTLLPPPPTYQPTKLVYVNGGASEEEFDVALRKADEFSWPILNLSKDDIVFPEWTDLGDDAADGIRQLSINTLAYIRDLKSVCSTLKATLFLKANVTSIEAWTNWWLSARWGDRLTVKDTYDLCTYAAGRISNQFHNWKHDYYVTQSQGHATGTTLYSPDSVLEIHRYLKLYYRPKHDGVIGNIIRGAMQWDVWPTLENAWDLIPFSFVADWFVGIGAFLGDIDRYELMLLHDVLSVLTSSKSIYSFPSVEFYGFKSSNFTIVSYGRQRSASLPSAPFRVDRGHLSAVNIIDGLSLLFQVSH